MAGAAGKARADEAVVNMRRNIGCGLNIVGFMFDRGGGNVFGGGWRIVGCFWFFEKRYLDHKLLTGKFPHVIL
jgi:hypothetical protein